MQDNKNKAIESLEGYLMKDKKNKIIGLLAGLFMLVAAAIILVGLLNGITDDNESSVDTEVNSTDESATSTDQAQVEDEDTDETVSEPAEDTVVYTYGATLPDVTEGLDVQGINTGGTASGEAKSVFNDGTYMLNVEFSGLPDPVDDGFYEGWLVIPGGSEFFSTGIVEKDDSGVYVDTYTDTTDWNESHTRYVLTLEPNDGDPAPADHIVEATMLSL